MDTIKIEVPIEHYKVISAIAHDTLDDLEEMVCQKSMLGDRNSLSEYYALKRWELWESLRDIAKIVR